MEFGGKINFRDRDNDNFCAAEKITSSSNLKEVSEDFILPDYLPDVKKVVWVNTSSSIDGRFVGAGTLEYEGSVIYRVFFITEDNSLANVVFTSSFSNKIVHEDLSEDSVDLIQPAVEQISCRLQNPRKFNIRARVGANVTIWRRGSFLPEVYGGKDGDESGLETRVATVSAMNMMNIRESDFTLAEDIIVEKSLPAIGNLVYTVADIFVDEARAAKDKLTIKGNCDVECLYRSGGEDGPVVYTMIRRSWPVTQTIDALGISEGYEGMVTVSVTNLETNVRDDESGERRLIEVDATYNIDAECAIQKDLAIVRDIYSLTRECQITTKKMTITNFARSLRENFSVNENFLLAELTDEDIDHIIGTKININLSNIPAESKKGTVILEGTANVSVVGHNAAGLTTELNVVIPIRFDTDIKNTGNIKIKTNARALNIRCRADNGKLYVDFEAAFVSMVYVETQCELVENVKLLGELAVFAGAQVQAEAAMILYYPDNGENLWDIAKKYGTTTERLQKQNSISSESSVLPKVIVIPA